MRKSFVIAALGLAAAVFAMGTTARADHCRSGYGASYGGYYGGARAVSMYPVRSSFYSGHYRSGYGGYHGHHGHHLHHGRGRHHHSGYYGRGYGSSFQYNSPGLSFGIWGH